MKNKESNVLIIDRKRNNKIFLHLEKLMVSKSIKLKSY